MDRVARATRATDGAEERIVIVSLFVLTIRIALPYLAAAMGGVWSERAGVVNVALEGTMLVGALGAVAGTIAGHSPWIGLLLAVIAGVALQLVHGIAVLFGRANAIVSGIALNLLAAGGTRFLLRALYDSDSNSPAIPALAQNGGTALDPATWIIFALVASTIVMLRSTPFGLRVRATGEHPEAAESAGVSVRATRLWAVGLAGACAGIGGAWLAFDQHQFGSNMSQGRGFIALAAVIVGNWRPGRAALFCLFFGFAQALQIVLQDRHVIAHQLVQMLPYLATLIALAGLVGRTRPPAALGKS
jgi:simple sugar transport system permease protein